MNYSKWKFETWLEYFERIIFQGAQDLACRIFGHSKPVQKLSCQICSRCRIVLLRGSRE